MIWRMHPLERHPCERSLSVIRFQTSEVFLSGNASRFTDQHTNESAREMERQTDGEGACGEFTLKDRNKNSTDSGDAVTQRDRQTAIQRQTLRQTASQRKCAVSYTHLTLPTSGRV